MLKRVELLLKLGLGLELAKEQIWIRLGGIRHHHSRNRLRTLLLCKQCILLEKRKRAHILPHGLLTHLRLLLCIAIDMNSNGLL